ncbi:MAG: hypothetical protein QG608_576 [Actinomycetota bacterium]|nr:hypothetical protein [Actinomycetota bacterium]
MSPQLPSAARDEGLRPALALAHGVRERQDVVDGRRVPLSAQFGGGVVDEGRREFLVAQLYEAFAQAVAGRFDLAQPDGFQLPTDTGDLPGDPGQEHLPGHGQDSEAVPSGQMVQGHETAVVGPAPLEVLDESSPLGRIVPGLCQGLHLHPDLPGQASTVRQIDRVRIVLTERHLCFVV